MSESIVKFFEFIEEKENIPIPNVAIFKLNLPRELSRDGENGFAKMEQDVISKTHLKPGFDFPEKVDLEEGIVTFVIHKNSKVVNQLKANTIILIFSNEFKDVSEVLEYLPEETIISNASLLVFREDIMYKGELLKDIGVMEPIGLFMRTSNKKNGKLSSNINFGYYPKNDKRYV